MQQTDPNSNSRHHCGPTSTLAQAIREARVALRTGRCGNLINRQIETGNLALWGRDKPMRAWTYEEAFRNQAYGPRRLP